MITLISYAFSRRGLLAYVYSGVFVWSNALVAGSASYIVRLSVRDLHGPTVKIGKNTQVFALPAKL